jgi:uracil-DNA glycosylase
MAASYPGQAACVSLDRRVYRAYGRAVAHEFDQGPIAEPFLTLAQDYPGAETCPAQAFRVEWGPVFHRGRLDGSARVVVIGQDPAASEDITRRILVGAAGHRIQGFLAELGINRSYVMVNTFLYSVYGQQGGEQHREDAPIIAYRNSWLAALTSPGQLDAVIALGHLADDAWSKFKTQTETISFDTQPPAQNFNGDTYEVAATATSKEPVMITIDPPSASVCSISGATVHFDTSGTCVIDANQAGNDHYLPAPQAQQPIKVDFREL